MLLAMGCDAVLPPKKRSVKSIVADLDYSEKKLNTLYETLDKVDPDKAITRSRETLAHIENCYKQLGETCDLPAEVEQKVQMSILRSHYLASKVLPELSATVAEQAEQVMSFRPDTDDAAIANVLLFCAKHDLQQSIKPALLKELQRHAKSFQHKRHGVGLYSAVAHEYWKNGEKESAEKVLTIGIAQYRDSKEKLPLVNQMIDQGHRNPPKPKISNALFARMQRAREKSFSGAATSGSVKFRS